MAGIGSGVARCTETMHRNQARKSVAPFSNILSSNLSANFTYRKYPEENYALNQRHKSWLEMCMYFANPVELAFEELVRSAVQTETANWR